MKLLKTAIRLSLSGWLAPGISSIIFSGHRRCGSWGWSRHGGADQFWEGLEIPNLALLRAVPPLHSASVLRMLRFFDSAGPICGSLRLSPPSSCCLPHLSTRSAPRMGDFGALRLACVFPCRTLHVQPRGCPRMTWGRDGAATPFTWGSFIPYSNAGLSRRFQNVPSLPPDRRFRT